MTEDEWRGVPLWFTEPTPAEEAAAEEGGGAAAPAAGPALKRLLWTLFADTAREAASLPPAQELQPAPAQQPLASQQAPAPGHGGRTHGACALLLPWESALLYLCVDRDLASGLSKAIAAVTRDPSDRAAAAPAQVVRMAWPLLGPEAAAPLQGALLSAEQVAAAARAAADAAPRAAQQLPVPPAAGRSAGTQAIDRAAHSSGSPGPAPMGARGVRAQHLLSSEACKQVVALLLGRYRFQDVYIRCRV